MHESAHQVTVQNTVAASHVTNNVSSCIAALCGGATLYYVTRLWSRWQDTLSNRLHLHRVPGL